MAANWYSEQPKNRNFLIPVGFKLDLQLFHGVDFFCQSASIPDISIPFATVDTPAHSVGSSFRSNSKQDEIDSRRATSRVLVGLANAHVPLVSSIAIARSVPSRR